MHSTLMVRDYLLFNAPVLNRNDRLYMFKTHNIFGKVNSFDFTNAENSFGGIYIVRDPRNVITSLKNHYS